MHLDNNTVKWWPWSLYHIYIYTVYLCCCVQRQPPPSTAGNKFVWHLLPPSKASVAAASSLHRHMHLTVQSVTITGGSYRKVIGNAILWRSHFYCTTFIIMFPPSQGCRVWALLILGRSIKRIVITGILLQAHYDRWESLGRAHDWRLTSAAKIHTGHSVALEV